MEDILVPIAFFAACFGIVYIVIAARNKERLAMIERGIDMSIFKKDSNQIPFIAIKIGLLLVGSGIGLFFGSLLERYTILYEGQGIMSLMLLFGGLGLVISFYIEKKYKERESQP